jgi:hypothetical protein
MNADEGRRPNVNERSVDQQKHLSERIAELRKSSETLAGWCLGSIIAASIRDATAPNQAAVTFGVAGVLLGVLGSSLPARAAAIDPARLDEHLLRLYRRRYALRRLTLLALLGGLGSLLWGVWAPR